MALDGTLVFGTEIDRSGLEKGSGEVEKLLKNLRQKLEDVFSGTNIAGKLEDWGEKLPDETAMTRMMRSIWTLRKGGVAYKNQIEKGNAGLERLFTEAESLTQEPAVLTLAADDQATAIINDVDAALDALNAKRATVYIHALTTTGSTADAGVDGSHAGGLARVPFDGYVARLHEGEAVLTRAQATAWRAGMPAGGGAEGGAGGGFVQENHFHMPVQTPDEFAKTMRLYATYGLDGVI